MKSQRWNVVFGPPIFSWSRIAFLLLLHASRALAGGVVTNCTDAALRAAMAGGGTVTFACNGTITLTNTIVVASDTLLDSSGRQVTVSGTTRCVYST